MEVFRRGINGIRVMCDSTAPRFFISISSFYGARVMQGHLPSLGTYDVCYFRDIELNAGLGQPEAPVRLPVAACIAGEARHPASAIRVYRLRRLRRKRLSRISDRLATG